jgi:hypothetical protein
MKDSIDLEDWLFVVPEGKSAPTFSAILRNSNDVPFLYIARTICVVTCVEVEVVAELASVKETVVVGQTGSARAACGAKAGDVHMRVLLDGACRKYLFALCITYGKRCRY